MAGKSVQKARGYDAVVVGTGLGGSTLAYRLAQRGMHVLVLEKGDVLQLRPYQLGEPVGVNVKSFPAIAAKEMSFPHGINIVGGQTKFYGAAMYRMRENDFLGISHEAGVSPAWPITYDELEPYYCEAERIYRVHGASQGDPTEPPRSFPFPHPPLPHTPLVASLVDRLSQSGTLVSSLPRALDYGPEGKCVLCSTCDAYYCRLDAKMDAETAALRPALASGYVELMTRTRCLRVLTSEDGTKATGVLVERDGEQRVLHADFVAVCAGVGRSAHLLLEIANHETSARDRQLQPVCRPLLWRTHRRHAISHAQLHKEAARNAHQDLRNKRLLQWCARLALSVGCHSGGGPGAVLGP